MGLGGAVFGGFPGATFDRILGARGGTITPGRNDYKRFRSTRAAQTDSSLIGNHPAGLKVSVPGRSQLDEHRYYSVNQRYPFSRMEHWQYESRISWGG